MLCPVSLETTTMDQREVRKRVTKSVSTQTHDEIRQAWQKLAVGFLFVFGVVIVVILVVLVQRGLESQPEGDNTPLKEPISMEEMERRAGVTAESFVASQALPEKVKYVTDPRRVLPLMQRYYAENPLETGEILRVERVGISLTSGSVGIGDVNQFGGFAPVVLREIDRPVLKDDRRFLIRNVIFADGRQETWFFEVMEDDEVRLIWEATVCYSDKDWETFIEKKDQEGGTFRVLLRSQEDDPYFNHDFPPDQSENYHCFRIYHPKSDRSVYGYLRNTSDDYKSYRAVKAMTNHPNLSVTATLRFPENAHGEQVYIDGIESFSWFSGIDM